MARFKIHAERSADDKKVFIYDNETNTLSDEAGFVFEKPSDGSSCSSSYLKEAEAFSKEKPLKKSSKIHLLKIQLGLSCNYACDYCSQKFVERPKETTPKDIENFLSLLDSLEFNEQEGLKVEFWGGEPFVYWKTMKPLAEAMMERFSTWKNKPRFSVITNGSILTEDICAWLYAMGFSVAISHDGPGQSVRGPDPFEDPKVKQTVLDFYKIMKPLGRLSFNAMLNSKNTSRKAIHDYFVEFTGDPTVILGEGGIVDAYDDDGINSSLTSKQDHFNFRKTAFNDIYSTDGDIGFFGILSKVDNFTDALLTHSDAKYLGQKCSMEKEDVIAIDLRGNVLTCQTVSAVETAMNGESHLGGNIADLENVTITSATGWRDRPDCASCPVLHICQGSCMYLQDKYWETSCSNSYSDSVALFALSIEKITGYIPTLIESENLPLDRQDIWGTVYSHKDSPKKRIIPIVQAKPEKAVVNDIEIYVKSQNY